MSSEATLGHVAFFERGTKHAEDVIDSLFSGRVFRSVAEEDKREGCPCPPFVLSRSDSGRQPGFPITQDHTPSFLFTVPQASRCTLSEYVAGDQKPSRVNDCAARAYALVLSLCPTFCQIPPVLSALLLAYHPQHIREHLNHYRHHQSH